MNTAIVIYLLLSLLGYSKIIIAASISSDVQAIPSDIASLPFDAVSADEEPTPSFSRVVGGVHVDIRDYPYQTSVQYSSIHICSGSIIAESIILTAAHCVSQKSVSQFSIRAGSNFRNVGGVTRAATAIYVPATYNSSTADMDIALIYLQSALTYGETINAVSLAAYNIIIPAGYNATTTGWGDGNFSSRLRGFTVPFVPHSICRNSYNLTPNMLCAGFAQENRNACQGESGGPLVLSRYGQIGIVSWGRGCSYRVYSSIPALQEWIYSVSGL
ncbi:trypsin-1-like [Agrilus planipennis]|uniref:Trypsin-1-like n=1 Tax=Agrilus planipennis TaxID=224129 RepID=A0A1W4XBM0_AGRPL|nr:trypsin-1-like [Agrilus planipennis]